MGPEHALAALALLRAVGGPALGGLAWASPFVNPGPSSPSVPSSWASSAGLAGAGPKSSSQVKACLCSIGLLSPPGCGNVGGKEGDRLPGAAEAVWYSHYQPSGEDQASRPLGHCGCLHTSTLPVDTRPPSLGQRCQLGNKGVQGPPKQPGSRPLRERRTHFWGGGGRLQVRALGGPGRRQDLCPWNGKEEVGEHGGPGRTGVLGALTQPAQIVSLPSPRAGA